MTLRTPRRRISPRTKRRYKAIKNFLRRALGSSSQPDIKINSSIAINVTDLKHKIVGLEHQLNEVNKHCQECIENCSRKGTESLTETDVKHDPSATSGQRETSSDRKSHETETRLIYKTSDNRYIKSEESHDTPTLIYRNDNKNVSSTYNMNSEIYCAQPHKVKKKKGMLDNVQEWNKYEPYFPKQEKIIASTSSYHSLALPRSKHHANIEHCRRKHRNRSKQREYLVPTNFYSPKEKRDKEQTRRHKSESPPRRDEGIDEKHEKKRHKKRSSPKLDHDFIADIIKRQYKPVKIFGKRESDISQFSAPICRDQEYSIHENIEEDSELCSCYVDRKRYKYVCYNDLSDMRSVCDTHLYSSKGYRPKHRRRHLNNYNDCTLYDLIPVKEKSSPKTRRKFIEDNLTPYIYYKEVPPSPKTHRPRLNLKAQYYNEYDDYVTHTNQKKRAYALGELKGGKDSTETPESDISQLSLKHKNYKDKYNEMNLHKNAQAQDVMGTMSSLQHREIYNEHANVTPNNNTFNKTQETDLSLDKTDKTDKTLNEIKDILQNFLQEIKKETTESQCGGSDISKSRKKQEHNKISTSVQNSGHDFRNFNIPPCIPAPPFMPAFPSNCCYPILPMCPMNCMQSGYIVPSTSFTCAACQNNTKETISQERNDTNINNNTNATAETSNANKRSETDDLIKEIYKFVAQNSNPFKNKGSIVNSPRGKTSRLLSTRSAGSSKISKHDAQVGTLKTKCYSKSCEAIGSKVMSDAYQTNASYSDTILEHLSLEATHSNSDSEFSIESTAASRMKGNKFSNILKSFGLFKKKKRDAIEELSESDSTIEVEVKPRRKHKLPPPFKQDLTNYTIHGQEFYQKPPLPNQNQAHPLRVPEPPYVHHGFDYRYCDCANLMHHHSTINDYSAAPPCSSHFNHPTAPPYTGITDPPYHSHMPPQVPLCLKEIEVKSIGTQSEKKTSFFTKLTQKRLSGPPITQSDQYPQRNCSTQTAQDKPGILSGWKNFQPKATTQAKMDKNLDPFKFQFNTQKKLTERDTNMRNTMLKKLLYKRNPFSPRNLIVRTLLGKDKSSWGEAPTMYRPRFLL